MEYSDKEIQVVDTIAYSKECYVLMYQALPQDNLLLLAEFQWLENRRWNDPEVEEVIQGMERLSSSEVELSQNNLILEDKN